MTIIYTGPAGRAAHAVREAEIAYKTHLLRCPEYENEAGSCAPCDTGQRLYQAILTAAENHRHTVETHERRIQYMGEHPDRFTDADRAQVTAGKCLQQTGYGLPWIEYCPDAPDGNSLLCARHRAENTEQYGAHTFGVTI